MMKTNLTNQSVVVIGGTSGWSFSIARKAATLGVSVTVGSRSAEKVAATAQ